MKPSLTVITRNHVRWSLLLACLIGLLSGCQMRPTSKAEKRETDGFKTIPIVSKSAAGWTVKPGHSIWHGKTTIMVNPAGEQFDIGRTVYPDNLFPTTLWIIGVKELGARFLILGVPPAASASVPMPILYLDQNDHPHCAGTIQQRFEFHVHPQDEPGDDPKILWDGEHRLRDLLFVDSDGDKIPELKEDYIWKEGGEVVYYQFTSRHIFVPLWREKWKPGGAIDGYQMVSRIKVGKSQRSDKRHSTP